MVDWTERLNSLMSRSKRIKLDTCTTSTTVAELELEYLVDKFCYSHVVLDYDEDSHFLIPP